MIIPKYKILPKFRTTRGHLTIYAFACGFMETFYIDEDNRVHLSLDGTWHIKGLTNGCHFWDVVDRADYKTARKCFNSWKKFIREAK